MDPPWTVPVRLGWSLQAQPTAAVGGFYFERLDLVVPAPPPSQRARARRSSGFTVARWPTSRPEVVMLSGRSWG